ncbi:MAG: SMP-30/gluconolactonase/LRE family protein [Nevskia sp.]
MIKRLLLLALFALLTAVLAAGWLLLSPSRIDPVAWTAPVAPKLEGVYAPNHILADVQRLAVGVGNGPEGLAVDAAGRIYAGYLDGRVIQLAANGASYVELANTHGRPLGIGFGPNGGLVVADAVKGLLQIGSRPEATVLATEADQVPFGFADDVDNAKLGKLVYFSDASSKFPFPYYLKDVLEHRPNGRLLSYDVETRETKLLLGDLYFANGVAVGPDDAYVLVNETSAYRITRYWLKGEKAGTHEVFADNLPGFPDNLSFNGTDRIWVAFPNLRDAQVDALAAKPMLRKLLARLPGRVQGWLQAAKPKHSLVLGFDLEGHVVANLQDEGEHAYAPITSVEERGPWLYFGSLSEPAIARLPLNRVIEGAAPPPAGWESAPQSPVGTPRNTRDDDEKD